MNLTRIFTWKIKLMALTIGLMASLAVAHFTNFGAKAAQFTSMLTGRWNSASAVQGLYTAMIADAAVFSTSALTTPLPAPTPPAAGCGASFVQPAGSPVSAGLFPTSVVIGDFNLDGNPDLAVAAFGYDTVTILLGNGTGGFAEAAGSPLSAGIDPVSMAVGDFNLDGKPDLAVVNNDSDDVTILLGNGSGGFTQPAGSPARVGIYPRSIVVGDFNLDGKPDLAVANNYHFSNSVTILLGNGSGGFAQAANSPIFVGVSPTSVAVGDFNLDGKPDLAVTSNGVIILLGNGSGGFTQATGSPIGVGNFPFSTVVGDFNLDGKPDLAVANKNSNNVTILVGDGTGGFGQAGSPISVGTEAFSIVVGDFNLDGKLDLAVANFGSANVRILLGDGSGGFTQAPNSPVSVGDHPYSVAVGDFNLDGKPDFATTNFGSDNVTIQLNTCAAQPCSGIAFSQPAGSLVSSGANPFSVAVGDFNLDGKPDFAVANSGSGHVTIQLGNGTGGFTQPPDSPVSAGDVQSLAVGDFNLDGKSDLAVTNRSSNKVSILQGNGSGSFTQSAGSPVSVGSDPIFVAVGDFNLDGKSDLAVANYTSDNVTILLGNGNGGFTQAMGSPIGAGDFPRSIAVGDFNLDGKSDLAVANDGSDNVTILLGNGQGGFSQPAGSPVSVGSLPSFVVMGDFNLDGKSDLAAANLGSDTVSILLGNGNGGFTQSTSLPIGLGRKPLFLAATDFNLDGKLDLAVVNFGSDTVTILLGNGSGLFTQPSGSPISVELVPISAAVGDFNLDGKPDLIVVGGFPHKVIILLNACAPPSNTPPTIATMPVSGVAGEQSAISKVATVGDSQDAPNTLSLKVNGSASATVNGVTVSNITVDAAGAVRANIAAAANATGASFTLRVTDSGGLFAEATLNVTVVGFTVNLSDPAVCLGPGGVVDVTAQVGNSNAAQATAAFTATPDANLRALAGTCTASAGTCSVNANTNHVEWNGTLGTGQSVTINYRAQVADAAPVGADLCVVSTASLNGGQAVSVTACTKANCPQVGPGALPQAVSPMSDGRAGSVLIYNLYTSAATGGEGQNTRVAITNTHPQQDAFVHLFFVSESCSVADSFLCLTPNQTATFLASDLDPGTSGYIVAVATDARGCPANFNFLIGDEYVKFQSGHAANLGAEAITAIAGGLPFCDANSGTAQLTFDGVSYASVPRTLALSNLASRADGNDTLLVLNRIGGNLGIGAATLGSVFGILYDDAEHGLSFSFSGDCQLRSSINNNFPRTAPRFEQFVPAGRNGWIRLYSQSDIGITGAAINFNANAASTVGAFNQGHNLHALTLTTAASYVIPVFPPSC